MTARVYILADIADERAANCLVASHVAPEPEAAQLRALSRRLKETVRYARTGVRVIEGARA